MIAACTITYAALLITGARIGELLGPRRTFLAGLAVFTGASPACGLAAGTGQLIAFRAVRGAGAAAMIPQVPGIIQRTYTGPARTRALGAYTAVMAVNAGSVFVLTLHFQSALHYSALRTRLTFVPTALAYGAVGLWWRLPRWLRPFLVPGGFVVVSAALVGTGPAFKDGGAGGGVWLFVAYGAIGAGLGFAHSPHLAAALEPVRTEHAADASGLVVTVNQAGLLLGASLFGTLFLNRLAEAGAGAPSRALWGSMLALAGAAAVGGSAGMTRRRT